MRYYTLVYISDKLYEITKDDITITCSQLTRPPQLPISGELGQEVRLELVQDTIAVTFQLEDKVKLQLLLLLLLLLLSAVIVIYHIMCYHLL